MSFLGSFNYWVFVVLLMIGLYGVIARHNLVKKVIALGLFQTAIFLLFISMGVRKGGVAPILQDDPSITYASPLVHVLILTAIVVSLSVSAVALAIIVNIRRAYGTIEADEIDRIDHQQKETEEGES